MDQKPYLKWRAALRQMQAEARAWGLEAISIQATHSVCNGFLAANQIDLDSHFDADMLDQMEAWVENPSGAQTRFLIVSNATDLSSHRSRIRDLFRACRALLVEDFAEFFRAWLQRSPFTYMQVSAQTGIPVLKIKTWLAYNSRFVADMTAEQAKKLDAVLGANRRFFAAYAAMTQEFVFREIVSAADQLLDRIPLGRSLREYRKKAGLSIADVVDRLQRDYQLTLLPGRLRAWEEGKSIPCREMQLVVARLDTIYCASGQLFDRWEHENPRVTFGAYTFPFSQWARHTQKQFKELERHKRRESDPVAGQCPLLPSGKRAWRRIDRWSSDETVLLVRSFCERFFGYLCKERGFSREDISLTLLGDWDLVASYFEWVRLKTGRARHGVVERNIAKILACIYRTFMRQLHGDAAREPHWRNLPVEACEKTTVAEGVTRDRITPLNSHKQRWEFHLFGTYHRCKQFYRHKHDFEPSSFVEKAQAVIDAQIALAEIAAVMVRLLANMPTKCLCRRTAILLRRLAVAGLLLARSFRPGTLRRYRCEWVAVKAGIVVKIPEDGLKQHGEGAGAGGFAGGLAEVEWINEAIRRWIEEGRPFLAAEGGASAKQGYLLVASAKEGAAVDKPFCRKLLELDSLALLGYSPYEHRYVFATNALKNGIEARDAATTMQNTALFVKRVYGWLSPAQRGSIHNDFMASMVAI